jgi:hypothetical protein
MIHEFVGGGKRPIFVGNTTSTFIMHYYRMSSGIKLQLQWATIILEYV